MELPRSGQPPVKYTKSITTDALQHAFFLTNTNDMATAPGQDMLLQELDVSGPTSFGTGPLNLNKGGAD